MPLSPTTKCKKSKKSSDESGISSAPKNKIEVQPNPAKKIVAETVPRKEIKIKGELETETAAVKIAAVPPTKEKSEKKDIESDSEEDQPQELENPVARAVRLEAPPA